MTFKKLTKAQVAELSDDAKTAYNIELGRFQANNSRKSKAALANRPQRARTMRREMQRSVAKAKMKVDRVAAKHEHGSDCDHD